MAFSLKNVADIDKERQITVFGYLREQGRVNKLEIIKGIALICILFYGNDSDEWDPKCIHLSVTLTEKVITNRYEVFTNSYCQRICESGRFKWKFEMRGCKNPNKSFMIGIRMVEGTEIPPLDTFFSCAAKGYGFSALGGVLTDNEGFAVGRKYGIVCDDGAIIEMILDLDKLILSYVINGIDYGKAFNVKKSKYRAAVYMRSKGSTVTLLQ